MTRRSALLVLAGVVLLYAPSLTVGYRFDDWHVLEQNPAIRSLANIPRFFWDPAATSVLAENRELRPVLMTSFALNYALSGDRAWSWHVVNALLHGLVVLFVYMIARDDLFRSPAVAALAAGLVAVHPLATEAVVYLSARSALLVTVFVLCSFRAAVREHRGAACLWLALGMGTKAIAVCVPALVALYYWPVQLRDERRVHATVALLALVAALGVAYRWLLLPAGALAAAHGEGMTALRYLVTEWGAYVHYLRLWLWPNALSVDRVDFPVLSDATAPYLLVCGILLVGGTLLARRFPYSFAWWWFLLALAPESTLFPLAEPVNDHRPYLALLGLAVGTAMLLRRLLLPKTYAVVAVLLCAFLAGGTVARQLTWQTDRGLWEDAIRKAPGNGRAWLNAGHAAMVDGDLATARTDFLEAHRLFPCYAYVQVNLSALARQEGKLDEAVTWADEAVACNPGFALAWFYKGAALEAAGNRLGATMAYAEALERDPHHADAHAALTRLAHTPGP